MLIILSKNKKSIIWFDLTILCVIINYIVLKSNPGTDDSLAGLNEVFRSMGFSWVTSTIGLICLIMFFISVGDGFEGFGDGIFYLLRKNFY